MNSAQLTQEATALQSLIETQTRVIEALETERRALTTAATLGEPHDETRRAEIADEIAGEREALSCNQAAAVGIAGRIAEAKRAEAAAAEAARMERGREIVRQVEAIANGIEDALALIADAVAKRDALCSEYITLLSLGTDARAELGSDGLRGRINRYVHSRQLGHWWSGPKPDWRELEQSLVEGERAAFAAWRPMREAADA